MGRSSELLERMNTFLRLMHEGLSLPKGNLKIVDVCQGLVDSRRSVEAITTWIAKRLTRGRHGLHDAAAGRGVWQWRNMGRTE